ncbi:hypothetical protein ACFLYV_00880 [Chloroflexota bacterium]
MIVTTTTSVTTVLVASLNSIAVVLASAAVIVLLILLVTQALMEPCENKKWQTLYTNLNISVWPLSFVFLAIVVEKVSRVLIEY